jgi:uncharacterized protein (DUF433 family)
MIVEGDSMQTTIEAKPVPLAIDEDGSIRVAGTRVTLDTVAALFQQGYSAEVIAAKLPSLTLSDVYATIAYCLQNPESVGAYLQRRGAEADALEAKLQPFGMPENLRQRLFGSPDADGTHP